jgi:Tfp pilus assembly PilM family ATPase
MPANPLGKLLKPRFPPCAVGVDAGGAAVVQLDRARGAFTVKRAASINLPTGLLRANFDERNIDDPGELTRSLSDLLAAAGLLHQRKWSVTLPETSTRAAVIALEGVPSSRRELEELLEWKIERSFGAPLSELRVSRDQLAADSQKQSRYLITAIRRSVLAEYEAIFAGLGWQAGLILPRHAGEQQWLRNGQQGDGLLLTAHAEGFTVVLVRNNRPIILRAVFCQAEECDDELHRVLLFYRERAGANGSGGSALVDRLLLVGDWLDKQRVVSITQETLGVMLRPLNAADVGLVIPSGDLSFDTIAAPAGLARMAW